MVPVARGRGAPRPRATQVESGQRWQQEVFLALQSFRLLPGAAYGDGSLCMRAVGKAVLWQVAESLLSQLRTLLRLGMVAYNSVASTTSTVRVSTRAAVVVLCIL